MLEHGRALERLKLTPVEKQAIQSAAAKMVADEAIIANRRRRAPIWRDRRQFVAWLGGLLIAVVVLLEWLHSLNPALP